MAGYVQLLGTTFAVSASLSDSTKDVNTDTGHLSSTSIQFLSIARAIQFGSFVAVHRVKNIKNLRIYGAKVKPPLSNLTGVSLRRTNIRNSLRE